MSKLNRDCINSWKEHCPDYEIVEWNEHNFNLAYNQYSQQAYANKKYAFVSDVARLVTVYEHGGFYFDLDVELLCSIDALRQHGAYFGSAHYVEYNNLVNTGVGFGAQKGSDILRRLLQDYEARAFVLPNGALDLTGCARINAKCFADAGFQRCGNTIQYLQDIVVYPPEWFAPKRLAKGGFEVTDNTCSIHHGEATWYPKGRKLLKKAKRFTKYLLGEQAGEQIAKLLMNGRM